MSIYQSNCNEYDRDRISKIVDGHLKYHSIDDDLSGRNVILKVNLLSGKDPSKAVTTHPEFVAGIVSSLKERGAECIIADSPGGEFTVSRLKDAYRSSGLEEVAASTGAKLNYDVGRSVLENERGRILKRIPVCNFVLGKDMMIALPKFKTHMLMGITCASKIMYGIIPGEEKIHFHTRFPHPINFAGILLDITDRIRPDLFIVDAIVGMEGEGPAQGDPRRIGLIASGTDNIEVDAHLCRVCGIEYGSVPIFSALRSFDGGFKFDNIEVSGDEPGFRLDPPFVMPGTSAIIGDPPELFKRMVRSLSSPKPVIDAEKCIACGICRNNCAGSAIEIGNDRARIDMSRCIRCFCCHELCPEGAISIKPPLKISKYLIEKIYRLANSKSYTKKS
ncbi:MAG: DUF362 domain-containing protein [Candidatus Thermoplasmatota archaeon]|nr:DUF362 domain-containing protein [Candidatus Thermoplasmatota archaeon]